MLACVIVTSDDLECHDYLMKLQTSLDHTLIYRDAQEVCLFQMDWFLDRWQVVAFE